MIYIFLTARFEEMVEGLYGLEVFNTLFFELNHNQTNFLFAGKSKKVLATSQITKVTSVILP